MKIGIVLSKYPVSSETFIDTFLGHLSDYEVILYAQYDGSVEIPSNWKVKSYLNKLPYYTVFITWLITGLKIPFYAKRFIALRKNGLNIKQIVADASIWTTPKLDILHFPFGSNAIGRESYAAILGAKMTLSFRGSDINVYPVYHKYSYSSLWPYVAAVHCNSEELAARLKVHNLPADKKLTIIYPALRKTLLPVHSRISADALRVGTPENPLIILTIGRLHWVKDYPLALRCMQFLKQVGINFRYHILGEGVEREQILFLINELNMSDYVFLEGKASSATIEHFLGLAHIYLQTSHAEGFSNACLEAQAFGLPCVVPAISGMRVCVEHKKTGYIVQERKEERFVEGIRWIIDHYNQIDPAYISKRVTEAFTIGKQRHSWRLFFETLFSDQQS
jgi:colanic acid/amylovoran biosynthesis glycosyltransferase